MNTLDAMHADKVASILAAKGSKLKARDAFVNILNVPDYLFVSTRLAKVFHKQIESSVVSRYESIYPSNNLAVLLKTVNEDDLIRVQEQEEASWLQDNWLFKFLRLSMLGSIYFAMLIRVAVVPMHIQQFVISTLQPVLFAAMLVIIYECVYNPWYFAVVFVVLVLMVILVNHYVRNLSDKQRKNAELRKTIALEEVEEQQAEQVVTPTAAAAAGDDSSSDDSSSDDSSSDDPPTAAAAAGDASSSDDSSSDDSSSDDPLDWDHSISFKEEVGGDSPSASGSEGAKSASDMSSAEVVEGALVLSAISEPSEKVASQSSSASSSNSSSGSSGSNDDSVESSIDSSVITSADTVDGNNGEGACLESNGSSSGFSETLAEYGARLLLRQERYENGEVLTPSGSLGSFGSYCDKQVIGLEPRPNPLDFEEYHTSDEEEENWL